MSSLSNNLRAHLALINFKVQCEYIVVIYCDFIYSHYYENQVSMLGNCPSKQLNHVSSLLYFDSTLTLLSVTLHCVGEQC